MQYTEEQIKEVQHILDNLDSDSIKILKEYVETEELPELIGFDTVNEMQSLEDAGLIGIDFDYVSEDSLAFWYEYRNKFYIAIDLLRGNNLCEKLSERSLTMHI